MANFLKFNKEKLIYICILLLTIISCIYFFQNAQNLLYADAMSRLDIARKVIDNLTPGLAQVGNVWLPLPQLLMVPFVWNNFMWHTGIAGAAMSSLSFIIASIYIYKSAKIITNSVISSIFCTALFSLNINVLYLQTTAMSELLFLCTLSATMFYFIKWFKTGDKMTLLPAAAAVSAMTLTRYEGLAILLSSIPLVFIYTYIQTRSYKKAEGSTIFYSTLACLGFGLWTLYLTVIFGDPLYWQHYYATPAANGGAIASYSQAKPFLAAVWQYLSSTIWMDGLIPTIMAIIAIPIVLLQSWFKRNWLFLPVLMPLSVFLFMVLTLQRNTPIVQPDLSIANILSSSTSGQTGFNIRYGLLLLPWVAITSAYLFNYKNILLKCLIFSFFLIQLYTYIFPNFSVIYQIPANIYHKPSTTLVKYMQDNYDYGAILVSASGHEDQMFLMGFDYKTYIHEGTNKYWKESLDDPSRYAQWIIIDPGQVDDILARVYVNSPNKTAALDRDFDLVFQDKTAKIYKKKTPPWIDLHIKGSVDSTVLQIPL